ncbi:hypothetical protein LEMLEM_LOCUS2971 [Lemmus lemmus]
MLHGGDQPQWGQHERTQSPSRRTSKVPCPMPGRTGGLEMPCSACSRFEGC